MDALKIEEEGKLVRGILRPQNGDFPVHERRKRGFRPAGIVRSLRQRAGLDESE